jgi:hypothetical protein
VVTRTARTAPARTTRTTGTSRTRTRRSPRKNRTHVALCRLSPVIVGTLSHRAGRDRSGVHQPAGQSSRGDGGGRGVAFPTVLPEQSGNIVRQPPARSSATPGRRRSRTACCGRAACCPSSTPRNTPATPTTWPWRAGARSVSRWTTRRRKTRSTRSTPATSATWPSRPANPGRPTCRARTARATIPCTPITGTMTSR